MVEQGLTGTPLKRQMQALVFRSPDVRASPGTFCKDPVLELNSLFIMGTLALESCVQELKEALFASFLEKKWTLIQSLWNVGTLWLPWVYAPKIWLPQGHPNR